jgi:hypothetical protein
VKWTTHPPIARHIETTTTLDDDKNVMYEFKLFTQTNPDQTSAHTHGIVHSIHRFPRCIFDTLQVRLSTTELSTSAAATSHVEPTPTTDDDRQ